MRPTFTASKIRNLNKRHVTAPELQIIQRIRGKTQRTEAIRTCRIAQKARRVERWRPSCWPEKDQARRIRLPLDQEFRKRQPHWLAFFCLVAPRDEASKPLQNKRHSTLPVGSAKARIAPLRRNQITKRKTAHFTDSASKLLTYTRIDGSSTKPLISVTLPK